ncbi:MAG: hypothetical protein Q6J68_05445 [Thermostichales cyanobacterium SZTDM-1c_bins_54]
MVALAPEVMRRFWALVATVRPQQGSAEEWIGLYRSRYGLSPLDQMALQAYVHDRLPLIEALE